MCASLQVFHAKSVKGLKNQINTVNTWQSALSTHHVNNLCFLHHLQKIDSNFPRKHSCFYPDDSMTYSLKCNRTHRYLSGPSALKPGGQLSSVGRAVIYEPEDGDSIPCTCGHTSKCRWMRNWQPSNNFSTGINNVVSVNQIKV